ncbi:MAG: 30S ribosomal protein S6 [Patescibacteria group bacterium]
MTEKTTRLYELGFILVPTIPELEVSQKVDALKSLIKKEDGVVATEGVPEYIDLAYTIERTIGSKKNKYSQGYFGWVKFETTPESLEALKKALDIEEMLVRYLLIKTDAANTITFKKPKIEAKRGDATSIDDADLASDESVDDIIAAHEALPDLLPEIEQDGAVEEKEAE